ncbi:MAG: HAD hydrolase-like protein [Deltaproteobacteria bacterium]|nr:HAD hydrolase-like protein [Deltaproteobacteria bacterium]
MKYSGVHIDIGGPLRISDKEMHNSEDIGFRQIFGEEFRNGLDFLTPMEAWQAYGMFSKEAYVGFMRTALAIGRSKKGFQDFMKHDDSVDAIQKMIDLHVKPEDSDRIKKAAGIAMSHYMANQSMRLSEGAAEALRLLKDNGVKMSIITSVVTPDAVRWIKEMGLDRYFPDNLIIGNSPEGATESDEKADNIEKACQIMGLPPEKTIYIGDTRGDMIAAKEAGCHFAIIRKGMTPPELFDGYMKEMPEFVKDENFFIVKNLLEATEKVVL